ncbi:NAD(P)/FAD-dependent oxidoreductase [Streptomyces prasinopilosus]|uniref:Glycine/D-amino acid oxidase n=1 Tax=Streptomyces prasinopilosus TaxID=67344 RepID=A0A1G6M3N3_9ACTN|nr:FAD-dependent oxidoreductase [Streptomyces prasinopilosus]SDC49967.1 Glycine/D-amino acid oxidase [Streptomyces prasinopilosus]
MSGERVDFAVVGGGIVGVLVAREISHRAPRASVALVERDAVGSGASRRSAGLHFPRGASERVRAMARYSETFYRRLVEVWPTQDRAGHLVHPLPIRPLPMAVVALAERTALLREHYLDSAALTEATDVPGLPGFLAPLPARTRLWRGRGCQYADVGALVRALTDALPDRVRIKEGVRVTTVEHGRTAGVRLRLGNGDELSAGHVVLAPGPWLTDPAWRELVAPLGARVKKVVALHLDGPPARDAPVVVFENEDAFLLPLRERGQWLFSYTCRQWDVDPDASPTGLSAHDLREAGAVLRRYAPRLAEAPAAGRVFCDAYSAGREPEIRDLGGDGRLLFAGAANGSGYRLGPAIAARVADELALPTAPRSDS